MNIIKVFVFYAEQKKTIRDFLIIHRYGSLISIFFLGQFFYDIFKVSSVLEILEIVEIVE